MQGLEYKSSNVECHAIKQNLKKSIHLTCKE